MESKVATQTATPIAPAATPAKRPYHLGRALQKEQETYVGRLKYNFSIINPLKALVSDKDAQWAKDTMEAFEKKKLPDGTVMFDDKEIQEIRKAHRIYS